MVDGGGGSDVVDGGAPVILRPRRRQLRVRLGVGLLLASSTAPPVDPNGGGDSSELRLKVAAAEISKLEFELGLVDRSRVFWGKERRGSGLFKGEKTWPRGKGFGREFGDSRTGRNDELVFIPDVGSF